MKTLLPLLLLLAGPVAFAQTIKSPAIPATGRRLTDFIPDGYSILDRSQATGDLNRDGRPDAALVLRSKAEDKAAENDTAESPPRYLIVVFGTPTGFALAAQASKVMLRKDDGGAFGDPFEGVGIAKGVLSISHYGGSSWRWSLTDKFRYQDNGFYLIGETRISYQNNTDCPQGSFEMHDTNFVTGEYEVEKHSETCKLLVKKRGKNAPKPLHKLTDYSVEP